jgi:hypothetical protein
MSTLLSRNVNAAVTRCQRCCHAMSTLLSRDVNAAVTRCQRCCHAMSTLLSPSASCCPSPLSSRAAIPAAANLFLATPLSTHTMRPAKAFVWRQKHFPGKKKTLFHLGSSSKTWRCFLGGSRGCRFASFGVRHAQRLCAAAESPHRTVLTFLTRQQRDNWYPRAGV